MPFESGTFSLTVFYLPKELPQNHLELFASRSAGMFDQVKDEPQIGWVTGRTLLESTIDEGTAISGGHLYLNMRIAERKIPTSLLKAICKREELVFLQANQAAAVPNKVRKQIRVDTMEKYLPKMTPTLAAVPFVIDMASNMLYLGTASTKQIDTFIALFMKTVDIEPIQLTVNEAMIRGYQSGEAELPSVSFSDVDDESIAARDFLTWLWYYSETQGAPVNHSQFGDFELFIEGPLAFAFVAEAKGAGETTVKKGSPLRSAEAKAALKVGKKLKKAKFTIARGKDVWSGTFDADKFSFGGLALPDGEEMEADSRFAERVQFLHIFHLIFIEYFNKFVDTIRADNWAEEEQKIRKWVDDRESL